jgi:hypothetical protein
VLRRPATIAGGSEDGGLCIMPTREPVDGILVLTFQVNNYDIHQLS